MNEDENANFAKARLTAIGLSTFFVTIPQILWSILGYRGAPVIAFETLLIIFGFLTLIGAFVKPPPKFMVVLASALGRKSNNKPPEENKSGIRGYLSFLMIPYIFVSYGIGMAAGFKLPSPLVLFAFLAVSAACISSLFYLNRKRGPQNHVSPILYYLIIGIVTMVWTVAFWYGSPGIPTDEFALDYYSAHLFLSGINPYVSMNTAGVFSFLSSPVQGFPYNLITPYTTGGYVAELTYPALSMLAYVPANLLKIYPSFTLLPFFVVVPLFLYFAYTHSSLKSLALIPVFLILLNPSFLNQASLGYPDILWVIFTFLSVYFHRKPGLSGLMMGAAAAVKQVPWVLIPFLLIFVFKESGGKASLKWISALLAVFLAINSFFILQSPMGFLRSVTAPELQQLVGIGFGPSQFAFLDVLPLSRAFFSLMVVAVFVSSVIAYVAYYRNLRFAFLAFPILIFLFNYRLLLNYVIYWPMIAFLIPVIMERSEPSRSAKENVARGKKMSNFRKAVIPAVVVVLMLAPVLYEISGSSPVNRIDVSSPQITGVQGANVTGMSLLISANSSIYPPGKLQVRILPYFPYKNMNGYLWQTSNYTQLPNGTYLVEIMPLAPGQEISWNGSYRLIAYYGPNSGAINFELNSGKLG